MPRVGRYFEALDLQIVYNYLLYIFQELESTSFVRVVIAHPLTIYELIYVRSFFRSCVQIKLILHDEAARSIRK